MAAVSSDPFAFGGETVTAAATPEKPTPSPEELAAAIRAEKRRRLAASVQRAADLIDGADVLVLHTGAGWSADSGLPVYRDVANLAPMQQRGLTYRDICDPRWLDSNPQLFIGFWGHCFNQYRDTLPHEGYHTVRRWREERFHEKTDVAQRIEQEMERLRQERKRRRREKGGVWQDEEEVLMQRDKGIVHPLEEESKQEESEQKQLQPQSVQQAAVAEAERVHITSSFALREQDEVRYSATVDSSTAEVNVAAVDVDGSGAGSAQSLSITSETSAIHTPSAEDADMTPSTSDPSTTPTPLPTVSAASVEAGATDELPFPPGWTRGDDDFVRSVQRQHVQTTDDDEEARDGQSSRPPPASAFFSLTSNVDAHFHRAGFEPHELYELHGNSETWQCSQLCSFDTWTPPPHFRFTIDPSTLLAPHLTPPPLSSIHISIDSDDDDDDDTPTHSSAAGSSSTYWTPTSSFATNVPRCPLGHLARPNVLMFNDGAWLRSTAAEQRYLHWMHAMLDVAERDGALSVLVLEVGCGMNVPTVRWRSESVWAMLRQRPHKPTAAPSEAAGERLGRRGFVRVNVWESRIDVEGKDEDCVSVELGGLAFVRIIDRLLEQKKRNRRQKRKADDDSGGVGVQVSQQSDERQSVLV